MRATLKPNVESVQENERTENVQENERTKRNGILTAPPVQVDSVL